MIIHPITMLLINITVLLRFIGEVGDLVVGRITTLGPKSWKADICAQKDATLQLSSVNLPGD
jgi:exosome complex component RRP4